MKFAVDSYMKIGLFLCLGASLSGAYALAGAFAFEAGMTKEQILQVLGPDALKAEKGDIYSTAKAPKPHPMFERYLAIISPAKGLIKVSAISKDIETTVFGEEVKSQLAELVEAVSKTYGEGQVLDFLRAGSIWKEPEDWMMGLLKKERTLMAYWKVNPPKDRIMIVLLEATALSREKAYATLGYEFEGFEEWSNAVKAKDADVF